MQPQSLTGACPPHHWQVFAHEQQAQEYWECARCREVKLPHQHKTEQFSPPAKWATFTDEDLACLGGLDDPESGFYDRL